MPYGGEHEKMGTHNHVLQSVLESIGAVDLVKIHPLQKNRSPHLVAYIHTSKGTKELRSDIGVFKGHCSGQAAECAVTHRLSAIYRFKNK